MSQQLYDAKANYQQQIGHFMNQHEQTQQQLINQHARHREEYEIRINKLENLFKENKDQHKKELAIEKLKNVELKHQLESANKENIVITTNMAALKSKYDEAVSKTNKLEATSLERTQRIQVIEKELAISQAENKRSQSQIIEHKQIIVEQQKSSLEANPNIGKLEEMSKQLKVKFEELTCK